MDKVGGNVHFKISLAHERLGHLPVIHVYKDFLFDSDNIIWL